MWIFRTLLLFVVILAYIRTIKVLITYYALHPINNSIYTMLLAIVLALFFFLSILDLNTM